MKFSRIPIRSLFGSLALLTLVLVGCGQDASTDASQVELARSGGDALLETEFEAVLRLLRPQHPGKYESVEQLEQLARDILQRRSLAAHARAAGIHEHPDVRYRIETILRDELIRARVDGEIKFADVTDDQVAAYYGANSGKFKIPEAISIHEVIVPVGEDDDQESPRRKATELAAKAKGSVPSLHEFLKLAREHATNEIPNNGRAVTFLGDMIEGKPLDADQARIRNAARELTTVGSVAGPIESSRGFHIVRFAGKRAERVRSLDSVREEVRYQLYRTLRESKLEKLLGSVTPTDAPSVDCVAIAKFQSKSMKSATSERGLPPAPPIPGIPTASTDTGAVSFLPGK